MIANRVEFRSQPPSASAPAQPRVGLALSGGGARGSAHMGVLRTLDEAGIRYDMLSATSIGALAGLIHTCGYSADYMIDACKRELMPSWWLSRLPGGAYLHMMRMLHASGIKSRLTHYIGEDCRLEDLPTPLYVTAADLISGELVVQDHGCAATAVVTSMSVPGLARPLAGENRLLVDGGILNNLPGDVLRERGADIVIGVDIGSQPDDLSIAPPTGMRATLTRSWQLMHRQRNLYERSTCDIVIRPNVSGVGFTHFTEVDRLADAGSAAAEAVVPEIRRLLAEYTAASENCSDDHAHLLVN